MSGRERRLQYLQAMGIPVWVTRGRNEWGAAAGEALEPEVPVTHGAGTAAVIEIAREPPLRGDGARPVSELGWDELQQRVATCTACGLHETRTQTVFGVGDRAADWLIIGEAPGADEDRLGEPFVGRAGKLLDAMLAAIRLDRGQVYIANILKCRPPRNRDPLPEEVACCTPFLRRQVALLQPRVILALGRIAAQFLLKTNLPLGRMRGQRFTLEGTDIPVVVTYHPAYLLRSPQDKAKAWQDLKLACHVRAEQA